MVAQARLKVLIENITATIIYVPTSCKDVIIIKISADYYTIINLTENYDL